MISRGRETVIVGHKAPEASDADVAAILNGTRDYIRDFRDAVTSDAAAEQIVDALSAHLSRSRNVVGRDRILCKQVSDAR